MNRTEELASFTQKLAYFAQRGVPLGETIINTRADLCDPYLRDAFEKVGLAMHYGDTFRKALDSAPALYPPNLLKIIEQAELKEELPETLEDIARYLKEKEILAQDVATAINQTIIPINFIALLILGIFIFLMPTFLDLFKDMSLNLPFPTRIIMFIGNLFAIPVFSYSYILALIVFNFLVLMKNPLENSVLYNLPIVGSLIRRFYIYNFARSTELMLNMGIPLLGAIECIAKETQFPPVKRELLKVEEELKLGKKLLIAISSAALFSGVLKWIMENMQSDDDLKRFFAKIADIYKNDILNMQVRTDKARSTIFAMILVGVVVILVISVFLPLYQLIGRLS